MGSDKPFKLAAINFSKELKPHTPEWESVRTQVHKALEQFGCFEATFDKIPVDIREALFSCLEELFDLPSQTKLKNISRKPYHGYLGQYPQVPLYESMGIDDANIFDKVDGITKVLWPDGNPSFSETVQSYSTQLSELDQIIRRMIIESLGVEKYMDEHMNSTNYILRVMKYTAPKTTDAKIGLTPHTDKNIVSILCQNQVEGLEVKTKDGKWFSVNPSTGSFVVMIGDFLHAWANGRLYSPFHRVMMRGEETRYSAGLFSMPKAGYIIKAPEELIDEENPLLFKPFDHVKFLGYQQTEAGRKAEFPLKAYCGV